MAPSPITWKGAQTVAKRALSNNKKPTSELFQKLVPKQTSFQTLIHESLLHLKQRVCLRGDLRTPSEIFPKGFEPKDGGKEMLLHYKQNALRIKSGIYLSKSLEGASFFPLPDLKSVQYDLSSYKHIPTTFVYVVNDPLYFNTSRLIAKIVVNADKCELPIRQDLYLRDLCFEEVTTPKVTGQQVLMAFHLQDRYVYINSPLEYIVEFTVSDYSFNTDLTNTDEEVCSKLIEAFPIGTRLSRNSLQLPEEPQRLIKKYQDIRDNPETPLEF